MAQAFEMTINAGGRLLDLGKPLVMGILNATPDSFFSQSRKQTEDEIAQRVEQILREGGDIIDLGAYSTRPGAAEVSPSEESARLERALRILRQVAPDAIVSVDTFRADVARMCVEKYGVAIVNDIAGGEMDSRMFETVAQLRVPYILTHMQGTPQTMQQHPHYEDLMAEILRYFAQKTEELRALGLNDIILDPGFGFGKTVEHNYELMHRLEDLKVMNLPILVGISRKSMIYKFLGGNPETSLNGTTVLNTIALMSGAQILRVHDVKECVEAVRIYNKMMQC